MQPPLSSSYLFVFFLVSFSFSFSFFSSLSLSLSFLLNKFLKNIGSFLVACARVQRNPPAQPPFYGMAVGSCHEFDVELLPNPLLELIKDRCPVDMREEGVLNDPPPSSAATLLPLLARLNAEANDHNQKGGSSC